MFSWVVSISSYIFHVFFVLILSIQAAKINTNVIKGGGGVAPNTLIKSVPVSPAKTAVNMPFPNFGYSNVRVSVFEPNDFFCSTRELRNSLIPFPYWYLRPKRL